jgi:hypothetical protein
MEARTFLIPRVTPSSLHVRSASTYLNNFKIFLVYLYVLKTDSGLVYGLSGYLITPLGGNNVVPERA